MSESNPVKRGGRIRMLNPTVIGQIAAGEVVERPGAAIKELVENSLDAGATRIQVEIREGGTTFFRVTDNGCGIDQSDIRMAFERHATSKIQRPEELYSVSTLGFRGEALASIAAVGRVELITRTARYETGLKVINEGGQIKSMEETACAVGTCITVRDLFFNTPARKSFLRKTLTETGVITDLMTRLILSRPDVSFRYYSNGKLLYQSVGDGKMSSAILSVYGTKALRAMREVNGHREGVMVKGFVGIGENARSNRGNECFFINGRLMRSVILSGALEDACKERVMAGRYPLAALYLEVPYDSVNVNVHPNKLEVRFRDEAAVRSAVFTAVYDALSDKDAFASPVSMRLSPESKPDLPGCISVTAGIQTAGDNEKTFTARTEAPALAEPTATVTFQAKIPPLSEPISDVKPEPVFKPIPHQSDNNPELPVQVAEAPHAVAAGKTQAPISSQIPEHDETSTPHTPGDTDRKQASLGNGAKSDEMAEQTTMLREESPKPMRIFGSLFNTYILVEYADQLLLVDQHAVHERLLYDKLLKTFEMPHAGQELLVPFIMSVSGKEQSLLEEYRNMLENMGLSVESFGAHSVAIRSMPVVLGQTETEDWVREILAELENGKTPGEDKKKAAILQMACKHAIKGGEQLTEPDIRELITQMLERKVTPTCPHGRPLVVSISHHELDKKFKRLI